MLLRSYQKGINKNNMSKNQKAKLNQHGMGDQGEIINFSNFFRKLFFSIFLQFLMHFLIPSGTNFITNMESVSKKKIQDIICQSWEMSARGNYPILVEISKNLKNCVVCLKFQCPKYSQIISKLINLASLNVEFYKFG